jgi:hypothetical protein
MHPDSDPAINRAPARVPIRAYHAPQTDTAGNPLPDNTFSGVRAGIGSDDELVPRAPVPVYTDTNSPGVDSAMFSLPRRHAGLWRGYWRSAHAPLSRARCRLSATHAATHTSRRTGDGACP